MEKRPFLIAVSGSHCVGKTTLVSQLKDFFSQHGFSIGILEEMARYFRRDELGTFSAQKRMVNLFEEKLGKLLSSDLDVVLADRCQFDYAVYTLYYTLTQNWRKEEIKEVEELIPLWIEKSKIFDVLIYANNCEKLCIVDDGFRQTDWRMRKSIDLLAKTQLRSLKTMGMNIFVWDISVPSSRVFEKLLELYRNRKYNKSLVERRVC